MSVKRTVCSFWKEGKCERGDACGYAHGEHELGSPVGPPAPGSCAEKRSICKFWQEGTCEKGARCTFAHGEHELGQQAPWAPAPTSKAAKRAAPYSAPRNPFVSGLVGGQFGGKGLKPLPAGFSGGPVRHGAPYTLGKGGAAGAPAQANVKRTLCKFFQEGHCDRGVSCGFAHSPYEIGQPVPGAAPVAPVGLYQARAPMLLTAMTSAAATTKRTLCKFFQEGYCERGTECGFAHGEHEIGQIVVGAGAGKASGGPQRVTVKRTFCKHFQEGNCQRGASCGFAHSEADIGMPVGQPEKPTTRRTMCKFHPLGTCERGDKCTFAHYEWELGTPIVE
mmetsp:Transcript_2969/g.6740  ORF Transcript_2969/g.6740 Transcript_2969/m.6740 type:complete len:335 (-) Transcript_2969:188-1192(-)|eukprot:CAMPEP_0204319924 /NCGR_PEP_ID=MMETSP0469-20131031/7368_1 /ASSEMBLY_ACC=CAM_ASM_000384 /TAXON_ID=2969 /ORGANISM="Oxyrrhis marina" /LENGTH=334 /DNA_ID=CAMNT_0051301151 /DNA_START=23 /DNA_END=1027 /DNA_ORIENTATION=-